MAVADLTITENRETVVDFTVPYMYYTEKMLLKKTSSDGKVDLLQFMHPFDNYVWFATLTSLFIISIAVFVINYFSPYGYKDENGQGTSEEFSFFNSVWFALSCMLQQGADNSPRSLSGKMFSCCLQISSSPNEPLWLHKRRTIRICMWINGCVLNTQVCKLGFNETKVLRFLVCRLTSCEFSFLIYNRLTRSYFPYFTLYVIPSHGRSGSEGGDIGEFRADMQQNRIVACHSPREVLAL